MEPAWSPGLRRGRLLPIGTAIRSRTAKPQRARPLRMVDDPKELRHKQEVREQEDVLRQKDHTTTGSRGLQQWGEQGGDESTSSEGLGGEDHHGVASMGTAERQARIGGLAPGSPKKLRTINPEKDE